LSRTKQTNQKIDLMALAIADPVAWMEHCFWVQAPLSPETGEVLPPGPIRFKEFQRELLQIALSRSGSVFNFQTIVWSSPKKTGKTLVAAAVTLWYAFLFPGSEIILLANDGRQATDRVFQAVVNSLELNPIVQARITQSEVVLPNGSKIYPLPVNAPGAAGANPAMTVFTEVWAYTTPNKKSLWVELTPPPTVPHAIRWVESYAGYLGQGSVLETLYNEAKSSGLVVKTRSPELAGKVMVSPAGKLLYYYDCGEEALTRFGWQKPEYYESQRRHLPEHEFARIHLNQWVSPSAMALPIAWLNACVIPDSEAESLVAPRGKEVVIGVDAGFARATFAIVGVSPVGEGKYLVRFVHVMDPRSQRVDFSEAENLLRDLTDRYPVIEIAYDPYQLHYMAQNLARDYKAYVRSFPQQSRSLADSFLYSLFRLRAILIPESLLPIIERQYKSTGWDPKANRFTVVDQGHNDVIVAMAMAAYRASRYML